MRKESTHSECLLPESRLSANSCFSFLSWLNIIVPQQEKYSLSQYFECYYGEKFISKYMYLFSFSDTINLDSVQFSQSVGSDSAIPWTAACQVCLSITNSRGLFKFMSIETMMPSSHLILCCPLLLLPSIFPCIRVFSKESVLRLRWPKYWSFSLTISPSNEH